MSRAATILHADLDAFYASVEQRDDQALRGKPIVVGAGVVLSASYEARAYGIYTPMGLTQARRLCPDVVVVGPRFSAYSDASKAVFDIFARTSPLVEGLSIDEAFLDVRGMEQMAGTPSDIAVALRREVREHIGLPITVGVARTKFLAKVASRVAKPDGLLVVPPEGELEFLHPLAVERLWGVGVVTARKLHGQGVHRVADVAALDEASLVAVVGRAMGRQLHALAHNQDPRPVHAGRRRRSIGSQRATGLRRLPTSSEALDAVVLGLVERVTRRMRAARRVGRTVVLRMRFGDYTRATRSHTLAWPAADTDKILGAMRGLIAASLPTIRRQGLTMVGLSVTNLENADAIQLSLPFDRRSDLRAVDTVVDHLRSRFGNQSVVRASLLGRDEGLVVPLLPD